jgi:hypothetical protein
LRAVGCDYINSANNRGLRSGPGIKSILKKVLRKSDFPATLMVVGVWSSSSIGMSGIWFNAVIFATDEEE